MLNSHSTFKFLDSSRVVLNNPYLSYNVSWSSFLLDHLSEISCFSFLIPLSYLVSDWMSLTNRVFHFCSHSQSYVLWLTILSIYYSDQHHTEPRKRKLSETEGMEQPETLVHRVYLHMNRCLSFNMSSHCNSIIVTK